MQVSSRKRFDSIFRVGILGETKTINLIIGGELGEDPIFIAKFIKKHMKINKRRIKAELW